MLLVMPAVAFAQRIPVEIAVAAVSPVFVVFLAGVLGLLRHSWRVAGAHAGLVAVWVVLAGIAMYFIENDYIIWTPLAIYALHAALIVILLVREIGIRIAGWLGRGSA